MAQSQSQDRKSAAKSSSTRARQKKFNTARRTVDGNDDGSHSGLAGRSEPVQSRLPVHVHVDTGRLDVSHDATTCSRDTRRAKRKPGKCEWDAS